MTKAVSNRDISFIKAVLLLCEHGHFFLNFASHGVNSPPILLVLIYFGGHHKIIDICWKYLKVENSFVWAIFSCQHWLNCQSAINWTNWTHANKFIPYRQNVIWTLTWVYFFQGWGSDIFSTDPDPAQLKKNSGSGSHLKSKWRKK